ncbi:hypothetical protein [Vibrio vulnificus]|uniref:hypothetical protein n=1 Tax=Vibrio vulnificus TaxID=672 RepID=UPI0010294176|nr:hypothetical protein [Vibrio vulnificus]RZP88981.1 hypothetical protein D8T54_20355 [Vibrio vulnificus]
MNNITLPKSLGSRIDAALSEIDAQQSRIDERLSNLDATRQANEQRAQQGRVISKQLCLHPFKFNVGTNYTLSAQSAVQLAGQNIITTPELGSLNAGIAIVITGADLSQLSQNVVNIANTLTFPALTQASALITQHALLPINKMQIPRSKMAPYWQDCHVRYFEPFFSAGAIADSLKQSESIDAITRLRNVAEFAKEGLNKKKEALDKIKQQFHGQCYALKLAGAPLEIKKQLEEWTTDGQPYALALIILTNEPSELSLIYETFSL